MRYLNTVFYCSIYKDLAKWMRQEHYPFAVDRENNRMIAFNLSYARMQEIVVAFRIREFDIDVNPNSRSPHGVLYKHVDSTLGGNAMVVAEYYRRKYHGQKVRVPLRHELISKAFFDEGYPDAHDARERICYDLYGIRACNPSMTENIDDISESIVSHPANVFWKNSLKSM